MPRATTCLFEGSEVAVEEALELKRAGRTDFLCVDCGQPVRLHAAGGNIAAHFEHLERNEACPLSDPLRDRRRT